MTNPETRFWKRLKLKMTIFAALLFVTLLWIIRHQPTVSTRPKLKSSPSSGSVCPVSVAQHSITAIKGTRYLMTSAFMDQEENGMTRIIIVMNRTHPEPVLCIFCCGQGGLSVTAATLDVHSDHFGFPLMTTDVLCRAEPACDATHVSVTRIRDVLQTQSHMFLPIRDVQRQESASFEFDFTLCISALFGGYNNVLQFVQTIEMHKLLGVRRVVLYNTSCGADLEKVLQLYEEEGTLEVVPWPIHHFLNPSSGWNYEEHKGDLHYYGQQATLNECVYRNRYRSEYVLLNDADEIIMPYKHATLRLLIDDLQKQHPDVVTFIFENHVFPKTFTNDSGRFDLPQWRQVPGVNILRHVHREPMQKGYNPTKMIINPRKVVQTSVHEVLKSRGGKYWVPSDIAIVMHTRSPFQPNLSPEQLIMDNRLLEFQKSLLPNVDNVLRKSGIMD